MSAADASSPRAGPAALSVAAGLSIAVAEGAIIEGDIKVKSGGAPSTFQEKRSTDAAQQTEPAKLANS